MLQFPGWHASDRTAILPAKSSRRRCGVEATLPKFWWSFLEQIFSNSGLVTDGYRTAAGQGLNDDVAKVFVAAG